MPSPIVYFQIASADPAAARRFYGELFDWRIEEPAASGAPAAIDPQGPGDFDVKGTFRQLPAGAASTVTPFFRVSDLWTTVARAEALGARVVVPIRQPPGGAHFAIVEAPDGQSVGIVQA